MSIATRITPGVRPVDDPDGQTYERTPSGAPGIAGAHPGHLRRDPDAFTRLRASSTSRPPAPAARQCHRRQRARHRDARRASSAPVVVAPGALGLLPSAPSASRVVAVGVAVEAEGELLHLVARPEATFSSSQAMGAGPIHGTARTVSTAPEDEALRQVPRRLGVEPGGVAGEIGAIEIERGLLHRAGVELDGQRVCRVATVGRRQRQTDRARRLVERDVDARDAISAPRLLQVRQVPHGAILPGGARGLRSLPREVERRHALFLSVGVGGEGRALTAHHQRVVVAQRRRGKIVRPGDGEQLPLRRHPHATAVEIARLRSAVAGDGSGEEEHAATEEDVADGSARRLPADARRVDAAGHIVTERERETRQIVGHVGRVADRLARQRRHSHHGEDAHVRRADERTSEATEHGPSSTP